jgi:hypothetical protein
MKLTIAAARTETARILTILIERVYGDGVDQIVEWRQNPDKSFSGVFLDRGKGPFQFVLNAQGLNYYVIPPETKPKRVDSYIDFLLETAPRQVFEAVVDPGFERFDGPRKARAAVPARRWRKPKNCTSASSISCGYSCISKSYVCHVNRTQLATTQEFSVLQSVANQAVPVTEPSPEEGKPKPKPLDKMTIRELRVEAQNRGVPGYSHVNKDVLLAMINSWDAEPPAQRSIVKVIAKREAQRQADPLKAFTDFWGLTRKIGRGKKITASVVVGVGLAVWTPIAARYTGNYAKSADTAKATAKTIPVEKVGDKTHLTFAVNRGRTADDDIGLEAGLKKADPDFFNDHHFVNMEMDGKPVPEGQRRPALGDAVENYNAISGHFADSLIMGRNPQAVQLAGQVLANARFYMDSDGQLTKKINLIGDREGGLIVNEAIEILKKADKKIAAQITVTAIGTPDFGLRNNDLGSENHHTITSRNDPMFLLPKRNPIPINDVKGGKLTDYLNSEYAVDAIAGAMGKHEQSNKPPAQPKAWQSPRNSRDPSDPRNSPMFGVDRNGAADPDAAITALKQRFGYSSMTKKEKAEFLEWARAEGTRASTENTNKLIRQKRKAEKQATPKPVPKPTRKPASSGVVNAPIDSVIPPPPKRANSRPEIEAEVTEAEVDAAFGFGPDNPLRPDGPDSMNRRGDSVYWKSYYKHSMRLRK